MKIAAVVAGRKTRLRKKDDQGDLELGDAVLAANVSYARVLALATPEAGRLIIGTIALLIASTSSILIPRFGGTIIDIVSRDLQTPEQKSEAVSAVNRTILGIFLIVIIGSVCTARRAWLFSSASERIVATLRKDLFTHLISQVKISSLEQRDVFIFLLSWLYQIYIFKTMDLLNSHAFPSFLTVLAILLYFEFSVV